MYSSQQISSSMKFENFKFTAENRLRVYFKSLEISSTKIFPFSKLDTNNYKMSYGQDRFAKSDLILRDSYVHQI